MSTYTPGPWEVEENLGQIHQPFGVIGNGYTVCHVSWDPNLHDSFEEVQANARLIAACPELLLACQSALRVFHLDSDMEEDFADEISQLERAIAKAEGRG